MESKTFALENFPLRIQRLEMTVTTETGFLEIVIQLQRGAIQNLNRDAHKSLDANHLLI
jgi:hypothetical protein